MSNNDLLNILRQRDKQQQIPDPTGVIPLQPAQKRATNPLLDILRNQETSQPAGTIRVPLPQAKPTLSGDDLRADIIGLNFQKSVPGNPQDEAHRRNIGKILGVDPLVLPPNAELAAFVQNNDPQRLVRDNPGLAKFLENASNAAVTGTDVPLLRDMNQTLRRVTADPLIALSKGVTAIPQTVLGLSDITNAIVMPWVNLIFPEDQRKSVQDAIAEKLPEWAADAMLKRNPATGLKTAQDELSKLYSLEQQAAVKTVTEAEGFVDTFIAAITEPSAAGQMLLESVAPMFLGAGISQQVLRQAAGRLTALTAGAVGEGAVIAGGVASKIAEEQKGKPLTQAQAGLALGAGVAGGAIGRAVGGLFQSKLAQKMGLNIEDMDAMLARGTLTQAATSAGMPPALATRLLVGGVSEGLLQEMPQSAIEQIAENVATGKAWDENVPESMALGLVTGAAMGTGTQALQAGAEKIQRYQIAGLDKRISDELSKGLADTIKATQANDTRNALGELSKQAAGNPLRKRSEEAFREAVKTIVDEEPDTVKEVYVDGKLLEEAFAQSGIDRKTIEQKMPELAAELKIATGTASDARISTEDYLTHIAGTPVEKAIIDNIRSTPDGMTFAEAQEHTAKQTEILSQQAKKILEENTEVLSKQEFEAQQTETGGVETYQEYLKNHQNKVEAFAQDANEVHQKILNEMSKAGRFTRNVQAMYAIPFREFFTVNAARTGVMPSELYARYPLNFARMSAGDVLQQFAGASAQTSDLNNLNKAVQSVEDGASPELVRQQTGWFRGNDGVWRYEISDENASFIPTGEELKKGVKPLGELLEHPALFAAYPELRNVMVGYEIGTSEHDTGSYNPNTKEIVIRGSYPEAALSTLLHEIQHGIQYIEGFAVGGNTEYIRQNIFNFVPEDKLEQAEATNAYQSLETDEQRLAFMRAFAEREVGTPFEVYRKLAGEVEARNTQLRRKYSDLQRKLTPPGLTADFGKEDVIVTFNGKVAENAPIPANAVPPFAPLVVDLPQELYQSTFYSALEREIGGLRKIANKEGIVKTDQAIKWLDSRQKEGKFKKEEVEAVGIKDWLNTVGVSVPVADVETFVKENGVQILDVTSPASQYYIKNVYGDIALFNTLQEAEEVLERERDWIDNDSHGFSGSEEDGYLELVNHDGDIIAEIKYDENDDTWMLQRGGYYDNYDSFEDAEEALGEIRDDYVRGFYDALSDEPEVDEESEGFREYTVGELGENYTELALTLPVRSKKVPVKYEVRQMDNGRWGLYANDSRIQSFKTEEEARSNIIEGDVIEDTGVLYKVAPVHSFEVPEADINRVAHIRFDERADENGKRVLFINEIQSDWGQEGRKKGFEKLTSQYYIAYKDGPTISDSYTSVEAATAELETEFPGRDDLEIREKPARMIGVKPGPFVKNTKSWVALSLKRMIRYAAENGFDRVAWTTGAQQNELYKLSTVADAITAVKSDNDTWQLKIFKNGKNIKSFESIAEIDLPDYVGKELAQKMVEKGGGDFSGLDLEVGGTSMRDFYDQIVPQVANNLLEKLDDGKVDVGNVIGTGEQQGFDITPELTEKVMQGLPLFQQQRAGYNPATFTISLLKGADLSSTIHEGGHFYLEALADMASRADAPQQVKDDFTKTLDWFGIKGGTPAGVWASMTLEQKRPYHEQWAQSFERYALEGKAPTVEMQPVFARFRAWMISVYKSVKEFLQQNPLAGRLNDDIRAVFDRLIASEEAIQETEKLRNYAPLFKSAEEAGMTLAEFENYVNRGKAATEDAIATMSSRSLRNMKWASNALDKSLKTLQAEAESKRKEVRKQITTEVMSEAVNRARTFFATGKFTDDQGEEQEFDNPVKLDTKAVKSLLPEAEQGALAGMMQDNGMHPDLAAKLFGYRSGSELVTDIARAEQPETTINALTDKRMLEQYGDLVDDESIKRAAEESVHNEARSRFMATGLKILQKSAIPARQIAKAAKLAAESAISNKKIRELSVGKYTRAEGTANREAIANAATNPEKAIQAQRTALLNNQLAKASQVALREVDAFLKYVSKFEKSELRKTLGLDYMEQIDDLLQGVSFKKLSLKQIDKNKSLADWIAEQEANGFEPAIDASKIEEIKLKSYKDMTLEEIRGLRDTIKQIEHLARYKKKLFTIKEKKEFDALMDEARLSIQKNAKRKYKERATPSSVIGRSAQLSRQFAASHRKFSSIVRQVDGGKDNGVMWNLLSKEMNRAGDNETNMKQEVAEQTGRLFKVLPKEDAVVGNIYTKRRLVPGTDISMSQEERVMFGMNWGNDGNRQRLLDGGIEGKKALSLREAEAILDTLTKPEWDFVQNVLDMVGSYKDQIAALERKLTGIEPTWIEPSPIHTKFGTYRGGYFPAKYDVELSTRSESLEAVTDLRLGMKGLFNASTTRRGYTQKRAEKVHGRPILLSYNVISTHLNEVIHRLAWQPWLTDANRILKALDGTLREYYGPELLRELRDTVQDIAVGETPAKDAAEITLNWLRTGSTIVGMGWKFATAVLQPTGLAQSWARIGGKWIALGIARYNFSPIESVKFVESRSVFLKNRAKTMNREINEILNTVRAGEGVTNITASYFTMMAKFQRIADIPTWIGAYEKNLAALKYEQAADETERKDIEDQAIALADQAVLDSQSGGQIKDLAKIQRGSPLRKLFTNFYSYFSATYNLNIEAVRRTNFKRPSEIGALLVDLFLLNTVPVLFAFAFKQLVKGGCDSDDLECMAKELGKEQANFMFGQMILLREMGAGITAMTGDKGFGYQGPAGLRFFSDLYKAGTQVGQGEADMVLFKSLNNVGGTILHYPAGQINATVEGIIAIENGDVEGMQILPALLFGPPRD